MHMKPFLFSKHTPASRPLPLSSAEPKGGGARLAGGALPAADGGARGPHAHAARGRRAERRVRRARQVPVHFGGGVRARSGARALIRARLALRTHSAPLQSELTLFFQGMLECSWLLQESSLRA